MRVQFSSRCVVGLAMALLFGAAVRVQAQQQDSTRRRTTSTHRIRVTKDRPAREAEVPRVNQDSINAVAAAERARQDSLAAAERMKADQRARDDQARRDSIEVAERQRQDSIAAVEQARQDSIARANNRQRSNESLRIARGRNAGFYMGIAGGSTMPMGQLKTNVNNTYDPGWNVTVPFGWDFSRIPFGIRFDLAMDNLTGKADFLDQLGNPTTARNLAVYSVSGGLKLNVPLFRTTSRFYLIGGAGAHRITGYATSQAGSDSAQTIQNAKTNVGWYGGAGFNFRFGRSALFIESRYININAKKPVGFAYDQATYVPVILGFQF